MTTKIPPDYDLLIAGTGMSGMALAIMAHKRLPHINICMLEKEGRVGGTWNLNTYPGAGCDVPSHLYSFSFAKNPNWSRFMSKQEEINAYQQDVARKFKLARIIKFETSVTSAEWSETERLWLIHVKDERDGSEYDIRTRVFVPAVGALHIPNDCDIKGAENFKGALFHSARWDHSVETAGKDVVVVGNGCSATQFVPLIAKDARHVRQFVRSMHYLMPNPDFRYSEKAKRRFARFPLIMSLYRTLIAISMDLDFLRFFVGGLGGRSRDKYQEQVREYIRRRCPAKYREIIVPDFKIGCKRRVMDTGYLDCLHRDNVDITRDGLAEIREHTVVTKSGAEYPADVICLANGFKVGKFVIPIHGRGGETLDEHWQKNGGPQAYFCTLLANFPNMFISMGPNSGTGHYSYIFTAECQNDFILSLLERVLPAEGGAVGDRERHVLEVTPAAERADLDWITRATDAIIMGKRGGCNSWYTTGDRNTALYPHFQAHFRLRSAFVRWQDFLLDGRVAGTRLGDVVYRAAKTVAPVVGAVVAARTFF